MFFDIRFAQPIGQQALGRRLRAARTYPERRAAVIRRQSLCGSRSLAL